MFKIPKPYITPTLIIDKDPMAEKKVFHYVYVFIKNDPITKEMKENASKK